MKIKENLENIKEIEKEEDEEKYNIEDNNKISINKDNNIKLIRDIGFIKRTILTNTHRNIVDDHIESLSTWKINKFRKILTIVGYFLSLGILFFITLYDNTIILKLYCDKANPEDSDYILITDYNNKKYLVTLISEILTSINPLLKMGYKNESKMLEIPFNSKYINKNDEKRFVNIYFIFKNVRYIYNSDFCYFSSAYFNLNGYKNNEILRLFDKKYNIDIKNKEITLQDEENENVYYPSLEEYNYLINKYGLNQILNESTELSSIILKQIFTGFNYFSIICEFIWFFIGYRIFAIIIFLFNLIVLIKSTKDSYLLNKRIYELDKDNNISQENNKEGIPDKNNLALNDANSLINNKQKNNEDKLIKETSIRQINPDLIDIIDNIEQMWPIVPGEVIKIKPGHKILFDGIILNGYCTVDESELTGETNEIYKTQIPNDNEYFQYPNSKNHFLFQGTIIKQCTNDNNNDILRVLVINTGMNTNRANLLLNLSFPKQENYSLNKDTFIYMLIMFIIFIGAIIFNIKLKLSVRYYFSDITIILSPILIISLSISSTFYKYYLEKNGVHCVDKNKIIVAGKSNVIALDKTGTLTENEFDLYGYQFTMPEEYSNNIYNTEIEAKNVNKKYINIPRKSFNISRQSELNNNKSIFGSISNINLNFISSKAQNQLDKTKSQKKLAKLNYDDEQNTVLSHLETSSKVLNKIHQTFWKDFSLKKDDSYKEDFKYNII